MNLDARALPSSGHLAYLSSERKKSRLFQPNRFSSQVDHTIEIDANGAPDVTTMGSALRSLLNAAFDDSASGTSPFATALAAQSSALGIPTTAVVDSAATLNLIGNRYA